MRTFAFLGACGALLVTALVACSSTPAQPLDTGEEETDAGLQRDGSVYDSAVSPESGLGELLFRPDRLYTGTDGTHTFKVPIAVYDSADDLAVTASDAAGVTITKTTLKNPVNQDGVTDNGKYFLVTAKKAGSYTLTASSKGRSATATVTISAYDTSRYAAGQARYEAAGTGATRPCTTCHVNGGAIDHSPAALATATDQEIGIIITTGVKPGPSVIKITSEPGTQHKWSVTDTEKDGLITYLRGIDPKGFQ
ncbi:MAG TPA: hypothetical protein VLT33_34210 [Labilithrix sp.]|nr:hypothetical protein [Labilithrix sp.]